MGGTCSLMGRMLMKAVKSADVWVLEILGARLESNDTVAVNEVERIAN